MGHQQVTTLLKRIFPNLDINNIRLKLADADVTKLYLEVEDYMRPEALEVELQTVINDRGKEVFRWACLPRWSQEEEEVIKSFPTWLYDAPDMSTKDLAKIIKKESGSPIQRTHQAVHYKMKMLGILRFGISIKEDREALIEKFKQQIARARQTPEFLASRMKHAGKPIRLVPDIKIPCSLGGTRQRILVELGYEHRQRGQINMVLAQMGMTWLQCQSDLINIKTDVHLCFDDLEEMVKAINKTMASEHRHPPFDDLRTKKVKYDMHGHTSNYRPDCQAFNLPIADEGRKRMFWRLLLGLDTDEQLDAIVQNMAGLPDGVTMAMVIQDG